MAVWAAALALLACAASGQQFTATTPLERDQGWQAGAWEMDPARLHAWQQMVPIADHDRAEFGRCKDTHRCMRLRQEYDPTDMRAGSPFQRQFPNGTWLNASVFADFNDFHEGSFLLSRAQEGDLHQPSTLLPSPATDPLSSPLAPSLFLANGSVDVNSTAVTMVVTNATFDGPNGTYVERVITVDGATRVLANGSEVAVFTFEGLSLGRNVSVSLVGSRPLALLSRSSAAIDTALIVQPGTVGGFAGGGRGPWANGSDHNGPGSPTVRVHSFLVRAAAAGVGEVQRITTRCDAGENIGGTFHILAGNASTGPIAFDAPAATVAERSSGLGFGAAAATRSGPDAVGAFQWTITFAPRVGDVPQLAVDGNGLTGLGASASSSTLRNGNVLGGAFRLRWPAMGWNGTTEVSVDATASPTAFRAALAAAPHVRAAYVAPWGRASQGWDQHPRPEGQAGVDLQTLWADGAARSRAWAVSVAVVEPAALPVTSRWDPLSEASPPVPTVPTVIEDGLTGENASVTLTARPLTAGKACEPPPALIFPCAREGHVWSTAYGGSGGSYGASGGRGGGVSVVEAGGAPSDFDPAESPNPTPEGPAEAAPAPAVGNERAGALHGGSGGCAGGLHPRAVIESDSPVRGGEGGGAIMIAAVNDVFLGPESVIDVRGANGHSGGGGGGGGGSGGTILITAGGTVALFGGLHADGGRGGNATSAVDSPSASAVQAWRDGGGGGGGSGGRVAIMAHALGLRGVITVAGGSGGVPHTVVEGPSVVGTFRGGAGGNGSVYAWSRLGASAHVDPWQGMGHSRGSLAVYGTLPTLARTATRPATPLSASPTRRTRTRGPSLPLWRDGTTIAAGGGGAGARPTRVSFGLRMAGTLLDRSERGRGARLGAVLALVDPTAEGEGRTDPPSVTAIGVGVVDGRFAHGANYRRVQPPARLPVSAALRRWYKVDIFLSWTNGTRPVSAPAVGDFASPAPGTASDVIGNYSLRINDIDYVRDEPFHATGLSEIRLHVWGPGVVVWFDEIGVGMDLTRGWRCPLAGRVPHRQRPPQHQQPHTPQAPHQRLWPSGVLGPNAELHTIQRHSSHLSRRPLYQNAKNGDLVPADGAPHAKFTREVQPATATALGITNAPPGNEGHALPDPVRGEYGRGNILTLAGPPASTVVPPTGGVPVGGAEVDSGDAVHAESARVWGSTQTHYLYQEHFLRGEGEEDLPAIGGIGACSSVDGHAWRNEGIMLHFENLSLPNGLSDSHLHATRPRVLYHNGTGPSFAMWFTMDNASRALGLAASAVGDYPNGPFYFVQSAYPPNPPLEAPGGLPLMESRDIVPLRSRNGTGVLLHTYYKTVAYWLPRPVMTPLWESPKVAVPDGNGGWRVTTTPDFSLNYHRAYYTRDYDDIDDIYLQRWRKENKPWNYTCCLYREERVVKCPNCTACNGPTPDSEANCDQETGVREWVPTACQDSLYDPDAHTATGCPQGYTKVVAGQAQFRDTLDGVVTSEWLDWHAATHNQWRPSSVPRHTTWGLQVYNYQTWGQNYLDAVNTSIVHYLLDRYDASGDGLLQSGPELDNAKAALAIPVSREAAWDAADRDGDGALSVSEIDAFLGHDPDLLFTAHDANKDGYLSEKELDSLLNELSVPRLDRVLIAFDPKTEGEVCEYTRTDYEKFQRTLQKLPFALFQEFDKDDDLSLTPSEAAAITDRFCVALPNRTLLDTDGDGAITPQEYGHWLGNYEVDVDGPDFATSPRSREEVIDYYHSKLDDSSLTRKIRDGLKADNRVGGTDPDQLVGPLRVVEERRAPYVAVIRLNEDWTAMQDLLMEVEGSLENLTVPLVDIFAEDSAFGIVEAALAQAPGRRPFRRAITPAELGMAPRYWNGREYVPRPAFRPTYTYGQACISRAGTESDCPPHLPHSPYATQAQLEFAPVPTVPSAPPVE